MDKEKEDSAGENENPDKSDFRTDLPTDLKQSITIAKDELDRGEGIPHAEVMAKVRKRFLNKLSRRRKALRLYALYF